MQTWSFLALLTVCIFLSVKISEISARKCSRRVSYTSYYRCGSWWRRRRCSRTSYRTVYYCCPGYSPPPNCPEINECASSPCVFGRCNDWVGRYSCSCTAGFQGSLCNIQTNNCRGGPCKNGGTCRNQINSYTCVCPLGYMGANCETNIDDCAPINPCKQGGACTDGVNDFQCSCPSDFSGKTCELSTNLCGQTNPCVYGACNNTGANSYSCTCSAGYTGKDCDQDIQDCQSNPCAKGVCIDALNGFKCFCNEGYQGDFCDTETNNCEPSQCLNGATCISSKTGFACNCADGYTGGLCDLDVKECNSHPCQNGGTCEEGAPGQYTCHCLPNFNGLNCEHQIDPLNDCSSAPCRNGATCEDGIFTYKCKCPEGFAGFQCQTDINECQLEDQGCVNGGFCEDGVGRSICTCWNGYTGSRCETEMNECLSAPCTNGAPCEDLVDGYKCQCLDGFVGVNCQDDDNEPTNSDIADKIDNVAATNTGILVLVIIITLVVIAVLVIIVWRKKTDRPVVPVAVRERAHTIRSRISHHFTSTPSPVYAASNPPPSYDQSEKAHASIPVWYPDDEEDMYVYGHMETDPQAVWKTSKDSIHIGKRLPGANGKFADIHLAEMRDGGGSTTVVAKMNKVGATEEDQLLMKAKMNFFGTKVKPPHENIVNLLAASPEGPILLLEYCEEGKLSDWLKQLSKVDEDAEDNMVNFTIQIARGMDHLHRLEILHRRLGARNVLLQKNKNNQLVAKLSGFGPMRGEQGGGDRNKERIPIKWMAPEQLQKKRDEIRHYSKATDVWSYAITCWEIFAKGETPYPKLATHEVPSKLKNGYRNERPKSCPDFIWDEVIQECWKQNPEERPGFDSVLHSLCHFYDSQGNENYDYDNSAYYK